MTDQMLKQRIQEDMKIAMKGGLKERLGVIRLIMAAIKQREVDERILLDDDHITLVLDKMVKQRRESISQYTAAGRQDLADVESAELLVLQEYLPQPLSEAEIQAMIQDALLKTNAAGVSDMGKVMAFLKPQMQGRADMSVISTQIKSVLAAR